MEQRDKADVAGGKIDPQKLKRFLFVHRRFDCLFMYYLYVPDAVPHRLAYGIEGSLPDIPKCQDLQYEIGAVHSLSVH